MFDYVNNLEISFRYYIFEKLTDLFNFSNRHFHAMDQNQMNVRLLMCLCSTADTEFIDLRLYKLRLHYAMNQQKPVRFGWFYSWFQLVSHVLKKCKLTVLSYHNTLFKRTRRFPGYQILF